jgi:hypothetical protein
LFSWRLLVEIEKRCAAFVQCLGLSAKKKGATYERESMLRVFSECVVAFGASEELRGRLVAASGLHLPNINKHVAAFGALHPHGWHSVNFVFFPDDC